MGALLAEDVAPLLGGAEAAERFLELVETLDGSTELDAGQLERIRSESVSNASQTAGDVSRRWLWLAEQTTGGNTAGQINRGVRRGDPGPGDRRPDRADRTQPAVGSRIHRRAPTRDALAVHRRMSGYPPSPLIELPAIARELGLERLWLKDESSRMGLPAFKILGASWAVVDAVQQRLGITADDRWTSKSWRSGRNRCGR